LEAERSFIARDFQSSTSVSLASRADWRSELGGGAEAGGEEEEVGAGEVSEEAVSEASARSVVSYKPSGRTSEASPKKDQDKAVVASLLLPLTLFYIICKINTYASRGGRRFVYRS